VHKWIVTIYALANPLSSPHQYLKREVKGREEELNPTPEAKE
jgi:hypothetical protein